MSDHRRSEHQGFRTTGAADLLLGNALHELTKAVCPVTHCLNVEADVGVVRG